METTWWPLGGFDLGLRGPPNGHYIFIFNFNFFTWKQPGGLMLYCKGPLGGHQVVSMLGREKPPNGL
jgi:hypothetical protein